MHRAVRASLSHAAVALAALALVGCGRKTDGESTPSPNPDAPVLVEVESHFQGDVTVYLVRGGLRQRLGLVTALSTQTFTFPWRWVVSGGNNRLMAYPIAGAESYFSDPFDLQSGQWLKWTLMADLGRSSLAVYAGHDEQ